MKYYVVWARAHDARKRFSHDMLSKHTRPRSPQRPVRGGMKSSTASRRRIASVAVAMTLAAAVAGFSVAGSAHADIPCNERPTNVTSTLSADHTAVEVSMGRTQRLPPLIPTRCTARSWEAATGSARPQRLPAQSSATPTTPSSPARHTATGSGRTTSGADPAAPT